jgi:hypothetical protein
MPIDDLLSRLDKVKLRGKGQWLACCPHHDDKSPSMSIRLEDDGRILIHCFANCPPNDILASIGMQMSDLFPDKLADHLRPKRRPFNAHDVLEALSRELLIVKLSTADIAKGKELSQRDKQRLEQARQRIAAAERLVNGSR